MRLIRTCDIETVLDLVVPKFAANWRVFDRNIYSPFTLAIAQRTGKRLNESGYILTLAAGLKQPIAQGALYLGVS